MKNYIWSEGSPVVETYRKLCSEHGLGLDIVNSPKSHDNTTLFCPSGMQQFKPLFSDESYGGETRANIQTCIRMNDLDSVGDGTHSFMFGMIGLFSFRHWTVQETCTFFREFVERLGIVIDHVTVHPDKRLPWSGVHRSDLTVKDDPECKRSDGNIGG